MRWLRPASARNRSTCWSIQRGTRAIVSWSSSLIAAPVQCSSIGYWSTTGLTEMDWYITDEGYSHGCEKHFTEKLWKLPHHAHCYYADESLPGGAWAPDPEGTIWLGSFNRYNKVRRETLSLWAKVLKALPCPGYCLRIG